MEGLVEKLCNRFNGVTGSAQTLYYNSGLLGYTSCLLVANLKVVVFYDHLVKFQFSPSFCEIISKYHLFQ